MEIANARQFHINPSLIVDRTICIPVGELYRQLTSVLRLHKGDAVRCFDGQGAVYEGVIAHINKDGILIPVQHSFTQPKGTEVTLAIGILKNDRMRWVLEKATELGATTIIPLLTERVIKRPDVFPPRWLHILRESAEQCGRAWLPELRPITAFHDAIEAAAHPVLYSTDNAEEANVPLPVSPTLFIGPEGGFTEDEVAFAKQHGGRIASLGPYQLRADTAAVVALASRQP